MENLMMRKHRNLLGNARRDNPYTNEVRVYCDNCKYKASFMRTGDFCKKSPKYDLSPLKIKKYLGYCEAKNKRNDCQDYEPKMYISLKGVIYGFFQKTYNKLIKFG